MPGGGRNRSKRPMRNVRSLYGSNRPGAVQQEDDEQEVDEQEVDEHVTVGQTQAGGRPPATRRLFDEEVGDQDLGGEDRGGEDGGGEDGGGEGSEPRKPSKRGITRLPRDKPTLAFRPVLRPEGDR